MDWQKIIPVIVSIFIIIFIAVVRAYSKTFAAIVSTMPINIALSMWIIYSAEEGNPDRLSHLCNPCCRASSQL